MCRLLGFVSKKERTLVEATGAQFTEFAALSARHGDGWGIATCNESAHPDLLIEPTRAMESKAFDVASHNLKSNGAILHLRWATGALAINEGNTHPFTYGDYSFMHNGALTPVDVIDGFVDHKFDASRRGNTDSESYFYLMMTEIEKFGVAGGIHSAVQIIHEHAQYSSINCMFLTPTEFFVVNEHNNERIPSGEPSDYYDLFYRTEGDEVLVASSGWTQDGWSELPNHKLMKVDRKTLAIEISDLSA
jgi:predicted glutamine amidotransferase